MEDLAVVVEVLYHQTASTVHHHQTSPKQQLIWYLHNIHQWIQQLWW